MIVYIPHISRKAVLVDREVIENSILGVYIGECYDNAIVVDNGIIKLMQTMDTAKKLSESSRAVKTLGKSVFKKQMSTERDEAYW